MWKLILKILSGLVLLIASQACAPQGGTTSDPSFINTAIAGTMAAAATQTSQPGILAPGSLTPAAGQDVSPTPMLSSTPAPSLTPTPNFAASYSGLESCKGKGWWVDIRLQNSGGMAFQSISMTVRNTTTNTVVSLYSDDFTNNIGCTESNTQDSLPPGASEVVSSSVFTYKPAGRPLRATIALCSEPRQGGFCLTQVIDFTP